MLAPAQGPQFCEPRRTITPGERRPPGGCPASGKAVAPAPWRPLPACQLLRNHFSKPRSATRRPPDATLRAPPSGRPPTSPPGRAAAPAPSLPALPVPVPVRSRNHAAGGRGALVPALHLSRPGPRSPRAQYSPPTRYMLAAMAVPAAASGRTKGSGRLGGAGLGSRRSPERGAGASRKSQSGPRSRHLRRLSRRGSSRSALSPPPLLPHARDAEADAGPLGFFRNELGSRRPKAGLRSLPPSQSPTRPRALRAAGKTGPARLGVRLLPEHLRPIRRTRPGARLRSESETPEIGHFRKQFGSLRPTAAPRSVISVAARPLLRRRKELRLTLSWREPCCSACGRKRIARPCASRGYLQVALPVICMNGLRSVTLSALLFSLIPHPHRTPEAPSRAPQKDWEATLLLVYCPSAGCGSQGPGWGSPAQPAGLYSVCRGAVRPLQGNALSGVSPSRGKDRLPVQGRRVGRGHAAGPVGPVWQRSDVQRGGGRQGGGSRGRSERWPRAPGAQHSPLKDAGVLATQRDEMRVVVGEPDTGHVAAVAAVHEAWRLGWGKRSNCGSCAAPGPALPPAPEAPGGLLTLARAHGYWKRCTLQKSSATATTRSLWERHRELMSVPSEPSGHTPSTVSGLSRASSPPPPTAQSCTVSGALAAAATHPPRSWQSFPRKGRRGPLDWICRYLDAHPSTHTQHSEPGAGSTLYPHPSRRVPQPCVPAHHKHGSLARRCRWPTPGLGSHSDSSAACSLQPHPLERWSPTSSTLTLPSVGKMPGREGQIGKTGLRQWHVS